MIRNVKNKMRHEALFMERRYDVQPNDIQHCQVECRYAQFHYAECRGAAHHALLDQVSLG